MSISLLLLHLLCYRSLFLWTSTAAAFLRCTDTTSNLLYIRLGSTSFTAPAACCLFHLAEAFSFSAARLQSFSHNIEVTFLSTLTLLFRIVLTRSNSNMLSTQPFLFPREEGGIERERGDGRTRESNCERDIGLAESLWCCIFSPTCFAFHLIQPAKRAQRASNI